MEKLDVTDYDAIILGTGFVESLLSGALSRAGKKVLHLDKNQYYGGSLSSFSLKMFTSFLNSNEENLSDSNAFQNIKVPSKDELESLSIDDRTSNQFSIELFPKIVWNRSALVDTLIRSGTSRYLEFKCIHTSYLYMDGEFQQVPWSKSDIFKNKFISLVDKRLLMKFLTSIDSPNEKDVEEFEQFKELPFIQYLEHKKLSDILIQFILYSITLADEDQKKSNNVLTTSEGYNRIKSFLSCMGRFSQTSPWIFPLYGTTDIHQSFCRLSAVYGGIFILSTSPDTIIIDSSSNKCTGVVLNEQTLNCKYLISNPENVSQYVENSHDRIYRCVIISTKSIGKESQECSVIQGVIPPGTFNNNNTIFMLQFDYLSCVTPKNKYLIHLWTKGTDSDSNPLEEVVSSIFKEADKSTYKACYFEKVIQTPKKDIPTNIFITSDVDDKLTLDHYVEEAKRLFEIICPNEEFIPEVPNPEDIIWENDDVNEEYTDNNENDLSQ